MSNADRSLAASSLVAGALGLLPLIAHVVPAVKSLEHYEEALKLYTEHIREPLLVFLHIDAHASQLAPVLVDISIFWIAIFLAINAFTHSKDGLFVWGHIARAYCYTKGASRPARFFCTLPKFIVSFVLAPIVCLVSLYTSLRTRRRYLTMAYLTVNPRQTALYLVGLFALPIFAISALAAVKTVWH